MALISDSYREQNRLLHEQSDIYGSNGHKNANALKALLNEYDGKSVLDYGCGKRGLQSGMGQTRVEFVNYDPAIPGFDDDPVACDIVVCADVLEHIEPECLDDVFAHIMSKMKKAGLFVIACRAAEKNLPDGRNTHQIVEEPVWWLKRIAGIFDVKWSAYQPDYCELRMLVEPK